MMEFIDFAERTRSRDLDLIFPGWVQGENVAFYGPHDDDVVLGAGYLLKAVLENGGNPSVLIFCRGDAGYSTPEEKETIVAARKKETLRPTADSASGSGTSSFSISPISASCPPSAAIRWTRGSCSMPC